MSQPGGCCEATRTVPPDLLVRGTSWHIFAQVLRSLVNQNRSSQPQAPDPLGTWMPPGRGVCPVLRLVVDWSYVPATQLLARCGPDIS
jgi:hypothetical protein